ncbi:MAG TPA: PilN domain-containing protein [Gemmatimonadaceae bacterium]|nr:PilN domain-containing protein [Gemmatimonadaceae bacterium]
MPDRVRAITVRGWRASPVDTFEIRWDPAVPRDAVMLLRQHLGSVSAISVAVGLGFTHVKLVPLPPVSDEERRAMLTLEPDRFFAIDASDVVAATRRDSDLVFAADAALVETWIRELENWAPVSCVQPSPAALARALVRGGTRDGAFRIQSGEGEAGLIELSSGSLREVRRIPESEPVRNLREAPSVKRVPGEFLAAYGAALDVDAPVGEMLVSAAASRRIRRRRSMGVVRSLVNMLLAMAFAGAALDRSRARILEREEETAAMLAPKAAGAAALQSRLATLEMQSTVAEARTSHPDPVDVLAALSRRLPRDAFVMTVRADGDAWQIDGTARSAGRVVPALDADPMFDDVRVLSGTSRFTEGGRTFETFSVSFHARR